MKAQNRNAILLAVALTGCCSYAAVNLMGFELPNVNLYEDKRGAGMPYIHETPHVLLGKPSNHSTHEGCGDSSAVSDATHPCHIKNMKLATTHAGKEQTQVPIYGILT